MLHRSTLVLLLAASAALVAPAQTPVTVATDGYAYSGAASGRHVVRSSEGVLYLARIDETTPGDRPIKIDASYDGGLTWTTVIASGINDAGTGAAGANPTNNMSLAIDDQDRLHVHWARHYYPSYFQSYYRSIDTVYGTVSPVVDVQAMLGVSTTSRTTAVNVAVGPGGRVWLAGPSSASWRTQLLRSNLPYASDGQFTSVGIVSVSASAQSVRMATDILGNVHCTYYENTGTGDYRHRMYDESTGAWSVSTDLGNMTSPNDYWGAVACDSLGNTHMLCAQDFTSGGNPTLVYYLRDASGVFSAPVTVMSATSTQLGMSNRYVIALACDEANGDAYVAYRDFTQSGALVFSVKPLGATSFAQFAQLGAPDPGQHHYYSPRFRGTLWPATNQTRSRIHITWREGDSPGPYDLRFVNIFGTNPGLSTVTFRPSDQVAPGGSTTVDFNAPLFPGEIYVPVVSCTLGPTPITGAAKDLPVQFDGCMNFFFNDPLSPLFFALTPLGQAFGMLDATGLASGTFMVPSFVPPGLNVRFLICFLTSNGSAITDISQVGVVTMI